MKPTALTPFLPERMKLTPRAVNMKAAVQWWRWCSPRVTGTNDSVLGVLLTAEILGDKELKGCWFQPRQAQGCVHRHEMIPPTGTRQGAQRLTGVVLFLPVLLTFQGSRAEAKRPGQESKPKSLRL